MDKFVLREPRTGGDYTPVNQMISLSLNAGGSNMIPQETIYFGGSFASEFPNIQRVNPAVVNAQHNMNAQHSIHAQHNTVAQQSINAQLISNAQQRINAQRNTDAQHNTIAQQNMNAQLNTDAQQSISAQLISYAQQRMNAQRNTNTQHNTITWYNMNRQDNINSHIMAQKQSFGTNCLTGLGHVSGIDPRYLAEYSDNSAQFIIPGQQMHRNSTPINSSFGSDYQNRCFDGIDRNKQKNFVQKLGHTESLRLEAKANTSRMIDQDNRNTKNAQEKSMPQLKKPNELDLLRNDIKNKFATRADKLKALHKSGPRAFSGPVEKVLKWHKSLQDIGVLVFYEIVAKCVSVRPGESCSKNLVVRDDNGPAMQIVYYEIDFMLPDLKPPCTIRVIGRMMAGTCRLQAFNVRPATGDDVTTLPRRAAVAAHHVAKLCKEYGPNVPQA